MPSNSAAPPTGSPFGYTGRQWDAKAGLYQYRARYYDPVLGIFLSMDPIGTKDDPNLYGYVGQDPVNRVDPDGLQDIFVGGQWDRAYKPMHSLYESRSGREGRPTAYVRHGDVDNMREQLRLAFASGGPVNVICHSRGCDTATRAVAELGRDRVDVFVALDPVSDGDSGEYREAAVETMVGVEGSPESGNFSDFIEGAGELEKGGEWDTGIYDVLIQTDENHANASRMYTAPGANGRSAESYVDETYRRTRGTRDNDQRH